MNFSRLIGASLLLGLFLVVGCNKDGGGSSSSDKKVALKTEDDKAFYALGVMFGTRLKELALTEKELVFVRKGLSDAALGNKAEVDVSKMRGKIDSLFKARISKSVDVTKASGKEFLEKFLKEPGVKKTASGLAYKVIKAGSAKKPTATNQVEVHYKGTLIDGTVFDSSYDRGKTITFPLNRVIPGWTEGLQLIGEGGQVKLVIPSDLAYGDRGAPPNIPGGSTLVFDVELFKVEPAPKSKETTPAKPKKK